MRYDIGGKWVKLDEGQAWDEAKDGGVSRNTQSRWVTERLHRSPSGDYYIEERTYAAELPEVRRVSPAEAAEWLLFNEHKLPDDLADYAVQQSGHVVSTVVDWTELKPCDCLVLPDRTSTVQSVNWDFGHHRVQIRLADEHGQWTLEIPDVRPRHFRVKRILP